MVSYSESTTKPDLIRFTGNLYVEFTSYFKRKDPFSSFQAMVFRDESESLLQKQTLGAYLMIIDDN